MLTLITGLETRIAELEAESERFTVHGDIERQDAEERAHLEKLVPDLKKRIAELEGLAQKLVWVGDDLLTDNANPVTITLFSGLASVKGVATMTFIAGFLTGTWASSSVDGWTY